MSEIKGEKARIVRLSAFCIALVGLMLMAAGIISFILDEQTTIAAENIDPATFDFAVPVTPLAVPTDAQPAPAAISATPAPALTTATPSQERASATEMAPRAATATATIRAPAYLETPTRIVIPAINLDAPIEPVNLIYTAGDPTAQWQVLNKRAAGWHTTSSRLGEIGNMVLNGHHNIRGRVFERLKDLRPGDLIFVFGRRGEVVYSVTERRLLKERGQPIDVQIAHASYIGPTSDERLTLVTCWPPGDYSHRLILIARPVQDKYLEDALSNMRNKER